MSCWHTQQQGWVSRALCWVKTESQKVICCIIPLMWHSQSGKNFSGEQTSACQGLGVKGRVGLLKGNKTEILCGDETVLHLIPGNDYMNLHNGNIWQNYTHTHTHNVHVKTGEILLEFIVLSQCHLPVLTMSWWLCKISPLGEAGWRVHRKLYYFCNFLSHIISNLKLKRDLANS